MLLLDASITAAVEERPLFVDLRVRLRGGEVVRLAGPSGSGKTTALRVLAGLRVNLGAWIRWFGDDVVAGSWPGVRARAVLVPPRPTLGRDTLKAGLREPFRFRAHTSKAWDSHRVEEELAALELGTELMERPCDRLSEGERLRAAVVRSLLLAPDALLLDEPTAALDPGSRQALVNRLKRFVDGGGAALLVTHDASVAESLDARTVLVGPDAVERA